MRNYYRCYYNCDCGFAWEDTFELYDVTQECEECGAENSPFEYDEVTEDGDEIDLLS